MLSYSTKSIVKFLALIIVAVGLCLRLYRISASEFLFYDEGMYLSFNRELLGLVAANPPQNPQELGIILGLMFKAALTTPKSLWFLLLNLRVFLLGPESFFFARLISAGAGLLTVALTYFWARRYFQSRPVALLSALVLMILPSHVFYSRLGMQESLSAFLFLAGMYFYVFSPRGCSWRSCLAAVLLCAVFFTNYRMIVAPVFAVVAQLVLDAQRKQKPDVQKLVWFLVIFLALVFGIGSLDQGANTFVTFGWMFHQAQESQGHRNLFNFLSFPYYLFVLENPVFGMCLVGSVYAWVRRGTNGLLPFFLLLVQMFLFSFAAEKGARYLCVVLPFAAMAAAYTIAVWYQDRPALRRPVAAAVVLMVMGFIWESGSLAVARTDYATAVEMVLARDPQAQIVSTQPLVESLHTALPQNIQALPDNAADFTALIRKGRCFLILDPQVYISWTADHQRFSETLNPYLEFVRRQASLAAVLPHIEGVLLKRFVLDHNQNLATSLQFLKKQKGKGSIYIYDFSSSAHAL